jgi:uncharacterized protein (TIGR02145 family)
MKNKAIVVSLLFLISSIILLSNSCKKGIDPPVIETGTLMDIDGNEYKTIKIGSKWWMAENLLTKRYRNGDSISYVSQNTPDSVWSNMNTGAYCYFEEKFGFLYNFYAITGSGEIAPEGWHLPSDEEWKELERYLGMSQEDSEKSNWRGSIEGNKMKVEGGNAVYWAKSSYIFEIFGTNESGFAALGGACRMFNGKWGDITHTGFWWTSSLSENEAWYRGLDYNKANVFRYHGPKNYGFSVRCVKD